MKFKIVIVICAFFIFISCIVQSPKYTTLEKVISLQLGMSKAEVEATLGIKPYDLNAYTDTSSVFIYIYRTNDRKTLSFYTKFINGRRSIGKYVQLAVTYSKKDIVTKIESCNMCPDNLVNVNKINVSGIIVFITVTLPVLLIYFGLKK
ncbi:MAG TPA: hypothetical protein VN698_12485 [Bacteroidia bacterium]|nr:hypothetical protein [Bacteroidia bacterium]